MFKCFLGFSDFQFFKNTKTFRSARSVFKLLGVKNRTGFLFF